MGAQVSQIEDVQTVVSKITNETILENSNLCAGIQASGQKISLKDIKGNVQLSGVRFNNSQKINLSCLQNTQNNIKITDKIKDHLQSEIENAVKGQNFGIQNALSSSLKSSIQEVASSIKVKNIKECLASAIASQDIEINGVIGDVSLVAVDMISSQETVMNCIQKEETTMEKITDLEKKLQSETKNTIAGVLDTSTLIIIAIAVGLVAFVILVIKMKK